MRLDIYRIFNALGDSIILCTYFKAFNVDTVFYNRADLDTLKQVMEVYGIDGVKFQYTPERVPRTMVNVVQELSNRGAKLLSPPVDLLPSKHTSLQLASMNPASKDRNVKFDEAKNHFKYPELEVKRVGREKQFTELLDVLKESKQHVTIDSGTAWAAAALGIETVVINKNAYYFPDAYHYMKYMEMQDNVEVYQQHGKGVRVPTEEEFNTAISNAGIMGLPPYKIYMQKVS